MTDSMTQVMRHIRNYFERERMDGEFTLQSGTLRPMPPAPYIAIQGSAEHDGVYAADALPTGGAETFSGTVWGLHPPGDFVALCHEIAGFLENKPKDGLTAEQFGIYRCQWTGKSWQEAFSGQLAPYQRMFTEVGV